MSLAFKMAFSRDFRAAFYAYFNRTPTGEKVLHYTPESFPLNRFSIERAGEALTYNCHGAARAGGWWTDPRTGADLRIGFNVAEKLCLIHSEISEAMEGHRKTLADDKLPHRSSIEVELADAVIRIFDLAGALDLDIGAAIAEKIEFNLKRPDHTREARVAAGGKAY